MKEIRDLIGELGPFQGMEPAHLALIAGCGENAIFEPGEYVMREGHPAEHFHVIRKGRVALEMFVPQQGGLTVETLDPGEPLGWSWLVPPFRTHLDARTLLRTHTIAFDATCLRGKCEDDPALGYELMKRFVPVMVNRLQATRFRLLDIYGHDVATA